MAGPNSRITCHLASRLEGYFRAKSRKAMGRYPAIFSSNPMLTRSGVTQALRVPAWRLQGDHASKNDYPHLKMTKAKESSRQPRCAPSKPAIIAAVFLGLHVLPLFWRPNPMWGVDFLFYLPTPVQSIFILLAVLLFFPGFRRRIRSWVRAMPFALWGRSRRVWVTRAMILILAIAAFLSLSSARHFLGDGYYLLRELVVHNWEESNRAPLSFALIRTLHYAGQAFWESPVVTYRIYSYASGALYILVAFPVAAALGRNKLEKSIVLAFLLTAGYLQLFFGYVENYPPVSAGSPSVTSFLACGPRKAKYATFRTGAPAGHVVRPASSLPRLRTVLTRPGQLRFSPPAW